jgi:hypothetical protein
MDFLWMQAQFIRRMTLDQSEIDISTADDLCVKRKECDA